MKALMTSNSSLFVKKQPQLAIILLEVLIQSGEVKAVLGVEEEAAKRAWIQHDGDLWVEVEFNNGGSNSRSLVHNHLSFVQSKEGT